MGPASLLLSPRPARHHSSPPTHTSHTLHQASDERTISRDEWDAKLAAARVPGGALNALVMDFLVTEVRVRRESLVHAFDCGCFHFFF